MSGFGVERLQAEGGFQMGNRLGGASQWVERVIEILFASGVGGTKGEGFRSERSLRRHGQFQAERHLHSRAPSLRWFFSMLRV